jgi:hypothetical protein
MSDFLRRLMFYGIGIGIGCLLVFAMFGEKATKCSYFPNERVIDELNHKPLIYSDRSNSEINELGLDSLKVRELLQRGRIDFDLSNQQNEPCGKYVMESKLENKRPISIYFSKCRKQVVLDSIKK